MSTNPLKNGALTENSAGIGTVNRARVHARAVELAQINGRSPEEITSSDWMEARRELTGLTVADTNEDHLGDAAESDRWNPVRGSVGSHTPKASGEDEDDEGSSDEVRLINEGMAEADQDQRREAGRTESESGPVHPAGNGSPRAGQESHGQRG